LPERKDYGLIDMEAQEEAAQDYLRLATDAEDETTLNGRSL